jgi:hypothetical protein
MYGGNCKGIYAESILALTFALAQEGHQVSFSKVYNESLITRARNNLAHDFMQSDADILLFVDADEGFVAADVVAMLNSDKELIGGIYPMKNFNWELIRKAAIEGKENLAEYSGIYAMNLLPGTTSINIGEPTPVTEVGTGLMAIRRSVFETMGPHCPKYAFNGPDAKFNFENMVTEYFATSITEDGILLSEDYHFCRKWRELGGEVYAAPWVRVEHAGEYIFNGRYSSELDLLYGLKPIEVDSKQSSDTTDDHSE